MTKTGDSIYEFMCYFEKGIDTCVGVAQKINDPNKNGKTSGFYLKKDGFLFVNGDKKEGV